MTLVIDASLALAWCLPGEATSRTEALLDLVVRDSAVTSALWPLEIANVLLMSERNGRTTRDDTADHVELFGSLPVDLDFDVVSRSFSGVLSLARSHGLTVYDASYLEVAIRRVLPLASNDGPLRDAAQALGVEVL